MKYFLDIEIKKQIERNFSFPRILHLNSKKTGINSGKLLQQNETLTHIMYMHTPTKSTFHPKK